MANKKIIMAIDNGKMNMKIKCGKKEYCYPNRYSKRPTSDRNLLGNNTYNVQYEDKYCTVGENGKFSDRTEGKSSPMQILQALTAITRFLKPKGKERVWLTYGESVDKYFDVENKTKIKTELQKKHKIFVNGEEYDFEIEQVQVLPEGIGHILQDLDKYSGVQYVVDIGGGTVDFLTVVNGMPDPDECHSFRLGVNDIISKVRTNLKRDGYGDYSEALIRQFVTTRECDNSAVINKIDDLIMEQLENVDVELSTKNIDLHDLLKIHPITFVGGGSELLKNQINEYYKSSITDNLVVKNALMTNVRGFHEYALAKFE